MPVSLPKACTEPKQTSAKGICFFAVDGTLTRDQFRDSPERAPVQRCLDAGWDVGVAAASDRTWQMTCEQHGDTYKARAGQAWITDAMCANLGKNGFATFLSNSKVFAGAEFQDMHEIGALPGAKKSVLISAVMKDCFPGLPAVLFEGNPEWAAQARHYRKDNSCPLGQITGLDNLPDRGLTHALCMTSAGDADSCRGDAAMSNGTWVSGNIEHLLSMSSISRKAPEFFPP